MPGHLHGHPFRNSGSDHIPDRGPPEVVRDFPDKANLLACGDPGAFDPHEPFLFIGKDPGAGRTLVLPMYNIGVHVRRGDLMGFLVAEERPEMQPDPLCCDVE